ncbi:MOSC domain-containing protein [Methylopila henanensis]|uniref:MOSC domain-containing protein n=1 Tax=Methylopila henanensis TaxID=873516 RepID=A0ABW4K4S2_9HYPH
MSASRIVALRRYPVKGLSPEDLASVDLEAGRPIAGDRAFAVENGPSGFDPARPAKLPKTRFLCLMRNARLAGLRTRYDDGRLTIERGGELAIEADLGSRDGREQVEAWLSDFMGEERRGPLQVLPAPQGHTFSDTARGVVSIISHGSVAAVADMMGRPVDPLRFRGNIEIAGADAWAELGWVGRELRIGDVRLKVTDRTVRCAATEVDPTTAERDLPIPRTLMKTLGHADCGVYAEVVAPGRIAVGDTVELA